MDVETWLRHLGLQQYAQAFRDNAIDIQVLPELDEADLERIGVAALGHRKRLLKAIAALPGGKIATAKLPPVPEAERRQLTVMFCDLVSSTVLSARLDPEDMRELLRVYQDAVGGAVVRYEGMVAKLMGDGVLAYFGFPHAHEDDTERATRAALDGNRGRRPAAHARRGAACRAGGRCDRPGSGRRPRRRGRGAGAGGGR